MAGSGASGLPPPSFERLRLLFLTVAAGALFGGYWFLVLLQDGWSERNRACGALTGLGEFLDCTTRTLVLQALVPLAGPALVAVLVVPTYLVAPAVITRWHGARPLDPWPEAVRETVEQAGLERTPTLMVSTRGLSLWMFTYGRRPRHRVMLSAATGLYTLTDTAKVTATLAHELGHLRNRDVDRTYLAVLAAACLALVTIVPVGLSAALTTDLAPALAVTWRDLVVALLLAGTWAAVVRTREHEADLWGGGLRPRDMLDLLTDGKQERRHLLRLHPPLDRRLKVLRDPDLLLRPSAVEALVTGIAAGVVVTELGVSLRAVLPVPPLVTYWAAGLLAAVPVSGIVGLAVWRAGAARILTLERALACGLALGAGLVAGLVLAPRSGVRWSRWIPEAPDFTAVAEPTGIPPITALWMTATLLVLTTAVTGWFALASRTWTPRMGTRAWRYATPLAALMLAVVMGTWSLAARLAASEQWSAAALIHLLITPQTALFLLTLTLLALCPLTPPPRSIRRSRTAPPPPTPPSRTARPFPLPRPLTALSRLTLYLRSRTALPPRTPRPRTAPLLLALGVALVLSLGLPFLSPAPVLSVTTQAALPDSPQAGVICLGLYTVGSAAAGAPADHAAKERLGEVLRGSDDDLLRQAGELFLRGARIRSQDLEGLAWTAFVRRCDHLRRYRGAPVPEPVSPFPTEGW
ncbi:M48 family metalloprotease [Streptosporangium saharense]|uniref:Zn-dependent protease with chaperone function n=1 Tax=Streptosporangium saharense TaxID=1706840 RepID=A0A7W7QPP8_9ACTN|nr:M48 family metalloprotease [Streptosporangium saharense]MBB4917388.1 Zn-dependent protease with chaperone function [Streptosporangium saharense]